MTYLASTVYCLLSVYLFCEFETILTGYRFLGFLLPTAFMQDDDHRSQLELAQPVFTSVIRGLQRKHAAIACERRLNHSCRRCKVAPNLSEFIG